MLCGLLWKIQTNLLVLLGVRALFFCRNRTTERHGPWHTERKPT